MIPFLRLNASEVGRFRDLHLLPESAIDAGVKQASAILNEETTMRSLHRNTSQTGFTGYRYVSMNKPDGMVFVANTFLLWFSGCCDADLPDAETRS
jgi:hypothetical protein